MVRSEIIEFARQHGFFSAEYVGEWNGYKCYEPIISENEISFIGLPLLILEDDKGILRMSTPGEGYQQISESI